MVNNNISDYTKTFLNKTIGKLTIKSFYRENGITYSDCECSCDLQINKIRTHDLLSGKRKSCGCLKRSKEKILLEIDKKDNSINAQFWRLYINRYTHGAKARNLEFKIDLEQFKELTQTECYYCGKFNEKDSSLITQYLKHSKKQARKTEWENFKLNLSGIDRMNPKIGYLYENCISCCSKCNQMKMDLTVDDFLAKVKMIYEKHL